MAPSRYIDLSTDLSFTPRISRQAWTCVCVCVSFSLLFLLYCPPVLVLSSQSESRISFCLTFGPWNILPLRGQFLTCTLTRYYYRSRYRRKITSVLKVCKWIYMQAHLLIRSASRGKTKKHPHPHQRHHHHHHHHLLHQHEKQRESNRQRGCKCYTSSSYSSWKGIVTCKWLGKHFQ